MRFVEGLGFNDVDYAVFTRDKVSGKVVTCPYYSRWASVLERCSGSDYCKRVLPTYKDASVCHEWLQLSSFKAWMEQLDWSGKHLDKDILLLGNKLYSPTTCVFVPQFINTVILTRQASRGELPLGVTYTNKTKSGVNPYRAQVSDVLLGKNKHLGVFKTAEAAHFAWQVGKAEQILKAAEEYQKDSKCLPSVVSALVARSEWLLDCSRTHELVTSL